MSVKDTFHVVNKGLPLTKWAEWYDLDVEMRNCWIAVYIGRETEYTLHWITKSPWVDKDNQTQHTRQEFIGGFMDPYKSYVEAQAHCLDEKFKAAEIHTLDFDPACRPNDDYLILERFRYNQFYQNSLVNLCTRAVAYRVGMYSAALYNLVKSGYCPLTDSWLTDVDLGIATTQPREIQCTNIDDRSATI